MKKWDLHFNSALTAINLAKFDWLTTKGNEDKPFSMSDYKTMYNNTLILELLNITGVSSIFKSKNVDMLIW